MEKKIPRILICEDDALIRRGITTYLSDSGFSCLEAGTGKECLEKISLEIDILILDVNLPDDDGFEICRTIRKSAIDFPILFLTVNDEESMILNGFNAGGDDYVTKPFSMAVLLKRINALLKRGRRIISQEIVSGMFSYSRENGEFHFDNKLISLSRIESEILFLLMENKNHVVSRKTLISRIWDERDDFVEQRTLDVNISRLRKKIEKAGGSGKLIGTIFGIGYKWDESELR